MKKLFTLIALMAFTLTVQAQHDEGDFFIQPRIGATVSNLSDGDKWKTNVALGVEFEQFFTDQLSIAGGLLFTTQGSTYRDVVSNAKSSDIKMDLYYGTIPITANYYILPGLALKAGLQPAFKVKAKARQNGVEVDVDEILSLIYLETGVKLNTFDLSIPVGLSYEFSNITLDARYNIGVTSIISGADKVRNQSFVFTLGYKFGQ
ncbi:MAG: PorT family protein [Bacteroidaceae bacterium]|nr:PorT family protein [Bacteroidaceae bacterium]